MGDALIPSNASHGLSADRQASREIAVSDRQTLRGLTQFRRSDVLACAETVEDKENLREMIGPPRRVR